MDGRVVGGATLSLRGKTAGLFGAGTLLGYRNRGVQTSLLHARLGRAGEAGCDLAVSLALPGSRSQRNITGRIFTRCIPELNLRKRNPVEGERVKSRGLEGLHRRTSTQDCGKRVSIMQLKSETWTDAIKNGRYRAGLDDAFLDEVDDVLGRAAGQEHFGDSGFFRVRMSGSGMMPRGGRPRHPCLFR